MEKVLFLPEGHRVAMTLTVRVCYFTAHPLCQLSPAGCTKGKGGSRLKTFHTRAEMGHPCFSRLRFPGESHLEKKPPSHLPQWRTGYSGHQNLPNHQERQTATTAGSGLEAWAGLAEGLFVLFWRRVLEPCQAHLFWKREIEYHRASFNLI